MLCHRRWVSIGAARVRGRIVSPKGTPGLRTVRPPEWKLTEGHLADPDGTLLTPIEQIG
jgi:hypothetical protein